MDVQSARYVRQSDFTMHTVIATVLTHIFSGAIQRIIPANSEENKITAVKFYRLYYIRLIYYVIYLNL